MPAKHLCIHSHFYQPPREDPWMNTVLPEGSAAPFSNWNERISRECYAPLGWARRQDRSGAILELLNCYEWMSFNGGPTLLSWMEKRARRTYARILEGDSKSLKRLGHGNAIAQVCHHAILPLAKELDKKAETAWGIADFEARFKRRPEGMWLAEAAVDTDSLEVLAEQGILFTILAPRQIKAVGEIGSAELTPVNEGSLDVSMPYQMELPSGRTIAVFAYDGPLSQAVAFEGLLSNGENFWSRLSGAAGAGLLTLATDGETYGHHFTFGEMALAHVLAQGRAGRDNMALTNYGAWLEKNPPTHRAVIHENSSWSCVHGVERWRSDCGCSTGGHPGWNQKWRAPLRQALDEFKERVDDHFFDVGQDIFQSPEQAFLEYGAVLSGLVETRDFEKARFKSKLKKSQTAVGWRLLAMQKWALASFASCAWFFDDIGRIEPLNGMTYALRSMDLARETGCEDLETRFADILSRAVSNEPDLGTGKDLWIKAVLPRRETPATIILQSLLTLEGRNGALKGTTEGRAAWPGLEADVILDEGAEASDLSGRAVIRHRFMETSDEFLWKWTRADPSDPISGNLAFQPVECAGREPGLECSGTLAVTPGVLPWNKLQALALGWVERAEGDNWALMRQRTSVAAMFQDYQEAQSFQTKEPLWEALWPALVWGYVFSELPEIPGRRYFQAFLKRSAETHSSRRIVSFRIELRMSEMAESNPPDWNGLEKALFRIKEIGLDVDYWQVQNRLWQSPSLNAMPLSLVRLLGFSGSLEGR